MKEDININSELTVVTGIWNLNRDKAGDGFKRPFSFYTNNFIKLLKTDVNMLIFVDDSSVELVWSHRSRHNTSVVVRNAEDFKTKFDFFEKVQKIRKDPSWYNSAEWLKNSTQATLELYNPMVMSKFFMLHDATCFNPFNSKYFVWIDGGLTNTVHEGYFTHDKVLTKINKYLSKLFFVSFPYSGNTEIHGFCRNGMNKYCNIEEVNYVCRGGFFGGHIDYIKKYNSVYYSLLSKTLSDGYMGTEESIFTIMAHEYASDIDRCSIDDNGLVSKFFEDLKNDNVKIINLDKNNKILNPKVSLYVLSFNSPEQFSILIESYLKHKDFISNTKNYLIDNSTDLKTTSKYLELCEKYNFEHIKKDNIGICGGRQFAAEHFDSTDYDFYIFLEDDMNLMPENNQVCSSGFRRYEPNLFKKALKIINQENYDFLKFSFAEFFGNNSVQWAWYNVPQKVRDNFFPENKKLPISGMHPNPPRTIFNNIKNIDGLPYADGEVYYCNWPQIVSREGNKKMFLDTKWNNPFEQTWMSHIFQENKAGKIRGCVLLLSPVNHHRFAYYEPKERKES